MNISKDIKKENNENEIKNNIEFFKNNRNKKESNI